MAFVPETPIVPAAPDQLTQKAVVPAPSASILTPAVAATVPAPSA